MATRLRTTTFRSIVRDSMTCCREKASSCRVKRRRTLRRVHDLDRLVVSLVAGRQRLVQRLAAVDDDREQVVEIVSDAAGELSDRLHLLRLTERLLLPSLLADVAGDGRDELHGALPVRCIRSTCETSTVLPSTRCSSRSSSITSYPRVSGRTAGWACFAIGEELSRVEPIERFVGGDSEQLAPGGVEIQQPGSGVITRPGRSSPRGW